MMKRTIYSSSSQEAKGSNDDASKENILQSQFRRQRLPLLLRRLGIFIFSQAILCAATYGVYIAHLDAGPNHPAIPNAVQLSMSQPPPHIRQQRLTRTTVNRAVPTFGQRLEAVGLPALAFTGNNSTAILPLPLPDRRIPG